MDNYQLDNQNKMAQERMPDIHDQYRQCKMAFDDACRAYQNATMQRAEAEKRLQDITQKLLHMLNDGLGDPTMPQTPQAQMPMAYQGVPGSGTLQRSY